MNLDVEEEYFEIEKSCFIRFFVIIVAVGMQDMPAAPGLGGGVPTEALKSVLKDERIT